MTMGAPCEVVPPKTVPAAWDADQLCFVLQVVTATPLALSMIWTSTSTLPLARVAFSLPSTSTEMAAADEPRSTPASCVPLKRPLPFALTSSSLGLGSNPGSALTGVTVPPPGNQLPSSHSARQLSTSDRSVVDR